MRSNGIMERQRLSNNIKTMTKILFICYGNIFRSPMAEYVMKDMRNTVRKKRLLEKRKRRPNGRQTIKKECRVFIIQIRYEHSTWSEWREFSRGLKTCHRHFFAAVCRRPVRIPPLKYDTKTKKDAKMRPFCFGRSGGIRTHGLLDPNASGALQPAISGHFRRSPPAETCSLPVLSPLIPAPAFR